MSIFAPLDPRGPDMRRKQLVQKLAQQAGASGAAAGRVPMPPRLGGGGFGGAQMGEGRAFHNASDMRLGGHALTTQGPNVLQSVLAKLGVLGHSHNEEVSQGNGMPIAPPAPSVNAPIPPMGAAIPTPAQATGAAPGLPPAPPVAPGPAPASSPTVPVQLGSAGTPASTAGVITSPGALPNTPGNVYTTVDATGKPTGAPLVDPGMLISNSAPVPLGNGLYYDPATQTILGHEAAPGAGDAARALPRNAGRVAV